MLQVSLTFQFSRHAWSYVTKAFDFGRAFLWEWTVNWRFVDEEVFLSKGFAVSLLLCHILTLSIFITTRYIRYSSPLPSFYFLFSSL